jgi:hypothetical protein
MRLPVSTPVNSLCSRLSWPKKSDLAGTHTDAVCGNIVIRAENGGSGRSFGDPD